MNGHPLFGRDASSWPSRCILNLSHIWNRVGELFGRHRAIQIGLCIFLILISAELRTMAFAIGDVVSSTANLNVRSSPGTNAGTITTEATGAKGTIIAGPQTTNGFVWWAMSWQNGFAGWSVQNFLTDLGSPPGSFTLSNDAPYWDTTPPAGPAVNLHWTASSGAQSYTLYRNGSVYTAGLTGLSYLNDLDLTPGQTYSYYVLAINAVGSNQSGTISVTMPNAPVNPPGSFTLSSATPGCNGSNPQIALSWTSSANATSYSVYRNSSLYSSGLSGTSFTDTGANVVAGTTYTYYIAAINSAGTADSGTLSATASSGCGSVPQAWESTFPIIKMMPDQSLGRVWSSPARALFS